MIIIFIDGECFTVANVTIGQKLGTFPTREEAERFRAKIIS